MVNKIHYCWFGSPLPDEVKRNIDHWAKLNPDFEIKEWNENNVDVSPYEFGRRALDAKKWGFLVDIVRPLKLIEEGGFYVDADIEMIRPLSDLNIENNKNKLLMGYMYNCALGTAMIYAPPQHPYLIDILHAYNYIKPDFWPVSNSIFTDYFINCVQDFLLNGKEWENDICRIFKKEFFEQPAFIKKNGISIHHCCGSWKDVFKGNFSIKSQLNYFSHLKIWASRQYRSLKQLRTNEFSDCYRAAIRGKRIPFDHTKYYTTDHPFGYNGKL